MKKFVLSLVLAVAAGLTHTYAVGAPEAYTFEASPISTNSATLNASVDPNGLGTTVYFEYGTNTSYGNVTSSQVLPGSTGSLVSVAIPLSGLTGGVDYDYRVVASNSADTVVGLNAEFTTPTPAVIIDPNAPVVRKEGTNIVFRAMEIPNVYNTTVNYKSATDKHYADGWRQGVLITNVFSITNNIDATYQQAGILYKDLMESTLGAGAHTNEAYTYEVVFSTILLDTNVSADVGVRIEKLYELLKPLTPDGRMWNFPYGQSNSVRQISRPFIIEAP